MPKHRDAVVPVLFARRITADQIERAASLFASAIRIVRWTGVHPPLETRQASARLSERIKVHRATPSSFATAAALACG